MEERPKCRWCGDLIYDRHYKGDRGWVNLAGRRLCAIVGKYHEPNMDQLVI